MGTITIQSINQIVDALASKLYVHPEDAGHPIVDSCRERGYEIISRDTMVRGRAFIRNAARCGILDLEQNTAHIGRNSFLDYLQASPIRTVNPLSNLL